MNEPTNHQFTARFQGPVLADIVEFPSADDFLGDRGLWKLDLYAPTKFAYVSPIMRTPQELNATSGAWAQGVQIAAATVLLGAQNTGGSSDEEINHACIVNFDIEKRGQEKQGCMVLCVLITDRTGLVVEKT